MRGPNAVRDRLATLLASEMPRKIPLLREAWGFSSAKLPDVGRYVSGDVPEEVLNAGQADAWVIVINPRLLRVSRTGDFSPAGEPEYRNRYACRVYLWVIGQDWDAAIAARDNLAVTARLSLLQYPTLTTKGGDTGYLLHEDTYTEDCGLPVRAKGGRCWAAAVLSVDVDVYEHIDAGSTVPPLGTVDTVTAGAFAVGPTAPLSDE